MGEVPVERQNDELGIKPQWSRDFPGTEIHIREVRRWIETVLPPNPSRDDVISIACEYASNAVQHSLSGRQGGYFVVELIAGYGSTVRIMVTDSGGPKEPHPVEPCDEYAEHGRGLHMVRELSVRRGFSGDANGRTSWADVLWVAGSGPVHPQLMISGPVPCSTTTGFRRDALTPSERRLPGDDTHRNRSMTAYSPHRNPT